jgi:hypothetical protein
MTSGLSTDNSDLCEPPNTINLLVSDKGKGGEGGESMSYVSLENREHSHHPVTQQLPIQIASSKA